MNKSTVNEELTRKDFGPMLSSFVKFASDKLGIKSLPSVRYKTDEDDYNSFAAYSPSKNELSIQTKNRHPMDILRSVAHELVHHHQKENGKIGKDIAKEGSTGSPQENEANAVAGKIMRWFAKENPHAFGMSHIVEAIFVVGGPCSGKDVIVRQLKEEHDFLEIDLNRISSDLGNESLIINGSASDISVISAANDMLKDLNYQTSMIFVDVENNISKLRNEQRALRGQRVLSESIRFAKYTQAQSNKERFAQIFGENMSVIDNSKLITEKVKEPTGGLKDACWKGYTAVGTKKKNGKTVPNCVPKTDIDEKFEKHMSKKKKVLAKEGDVLGASVAPLPNVDSVGPEFDLVKNNSIIGGASPMSSGIYGSVYTYSTYGMSESIHTWAMKPETQDRFVRKYGALAEQKLLETMMSLNESLSDSKATGPKHFSVIRESLDRKVDYPADTEVYSGSVPSAGRYKDGDFVEEGSVRDMPCNKPKAQATGDSKTGKSHVVKACSGGKEKVIRFGQRGVKGSPKKEGESEAYANRRARFKARHAQNIKKGKMSAAYWSNKVKW